MKFLHAGVSCEFPIISGMGSFINAKKERGDSVVELDNFKSTLISYKNPLQEVRDSL